MGGQGGGALGEYDAEFAGGAPEEADKHGSPPRAEWLAGAWSGGHRIGRFVRGGGRAVESQAADERLHVHSGALLPLHGYGSPGIGGSRSLLLVGAASSELERLAVWSTLKLNSKGAQAVDCWTSPFARCTVPGGS